MTRTHTRGTPRPQKAATAPTRGAGRPIGELWTTPEGHAARARSAAQYQGLLQLVETGELIRNVRLLEGETADVAWRQVKP